MINFVLTTLSSFWRIPIVIVSIPTSHEFTSLYNSYIRHKIKYTHNHKRHTTNTHTPHTDNNTPPLTNLLTISAHWFYFWTQSVQCTSHKITNVCRHRRLRLLHPPSAGPRRPHDAPPERQQQQQRGRRPRASAAPRRRHLRSRRPGPNGGHFAPCPHRQCTHR